ncbi:ABC transporter permease [Lentilactobacillus rapi]|uniref:ABC transporter permease n=1 Tax=Lentilactobacillus rapi TaxID=481723 RepID=UPI003BF5D0C0
MFVSNYAADSFVALLLIGSAASLISSEFEYNTMKNIVCQIHSRPKILLAKWLLLLTYSVFLYIWFSGLTYLNQFIFF